MPKLHVIVASTRPGRAGTPIAKWFHDFAVQHAAFEAKLVELSDVGLPLLDEPAHPRLQKYEHAHTKAWSALVSEADAFVFVTPEYNYSSPPALINALDYLFVEWGYKAAGFVSYGGISGGIRSVQMTKLLLTTVKVVPLPEAVVIPFFAQQLKEGRFEANESQLKSAEGLLNELSKWTKALLPLRAT